MLGFSKVSAPLEVWAGLECTINRVQEEYFDQCVQNGHDYRRSDLSLFAELGVQRIRYPFLWEKIELSEGEYRWEIVDRQIEALKNFGLSPIAGLLHHGSGPKFTNLLDPSFPLKFATFARAFAERYPLIEDYTPINEPLTTARFSALYGHWYPHKHSDRSFVKALLNQIEATRLAMKEIRKVNPRARLIQTEDFGRILSTPSLHYQAHFENERRCLSFDLLSGRIDELHPLWTYLRRSGLSLQTATSLQDKPCTPDIIGINHYPLSNRFLDHRIQNYPKCFHGGNGIDTYADVGTVDCAGAEPPSAKSILSEVWERYHLPIAVTEAHISGTRESQMRWLSEIWNSAQELRQSGVDIRAVTAWSLLGSFDWNSLCTKRNNFYESGIFDVRGGKPRATALAKMIKSYSEIGHYDHPVLEQPGWWKTEHRILFPENKRISPAPRRGRQPLLIVGGKGTLAQAFARICTRRNLPFILTERDDLDITKPHLIRNILQDATPWAVINTAGFADVDRAELEPDRCYFENVFAVKNLAEACSDIKIPLLTFSSDLVFNGVKNQPYQESDLVSPLNVFGRSKAESEKHALDIHPNSLIIRTSSCFGPWDQLNFVTKTLTSLQRNERISAAQDVRISPTYIPHLVNSSLDLLIDGEKGIVHLTNQGETTWSELAQMALEFGLEKMNLTTKHKNLICSLPAREMSWRALRPPYSVLGSERFQILPSFEEGLHCYFSEREIQ